MKIDFLTLFPEMFQGVLGSSILQKAQEKRLSVLTSSISGLFRIINTKRLMITRTAGSRDGVKAAACI